MNAESFVESGHSLLRPSVDLDGRAIHVHFPVADLVEPCPGQCVRSG